MGSGHRDDGTLRPDTADHPNRKVSQWSAAMDARTREYERARSGEMSPEDAARVDINYKATKAYYDKRKPAE